jgi:hypothetical protein
MRLDEEGRMAEPAAGRTAGRWLDVKLAAEELGISSDAVRKRIARGTLRSAKDDDGSVQVWLDGTYEGLDEDPPGDQPKGWTEAGHRRDDLIDAKDEALRDLRDQLEHMRRESERKDAIIMQLSQASAALAARVPELEASTEPRESWKSASESSPDGNGREEEREKRRRGWWARVFLGPEGEKT